MAFAITIGGVDKTTTVTFKTFRKRDNLNQQVDTCTFDINRKGSETYTPEVGDEVVVTRDAVIIFGGVILRIDERVEASTIITYSVECADYSQYLKRHLVTERYTATTVGDIIDNLVATYTTVGDGITTTGVVGGQTIESFSFNRLTVADCLQKLADALSFVWYVGYDKSIHFFPKNEELAPYGLTDTSSNYIYDSLSITEDISQVRNSVLVQGGNAISSSTRTEYWSGDGTRTQFPLTNKYDQRPTVTVGGIAQLVGVEYLDSDASFDVMWNYNEKYLRFTAGHTPTAAANNIAITGTYEDPIVVKVPAPASIASFGTYEFAITDKSIRSQDEAIARASAELAGYKSTLYEGQFKTYTDGLRSGQVININSTQRGKNIDVLVQSVDVVMRDPLGTKLEYTVKFATLKSIGIIDYLQAQLRSKEVIQDDSETLLNYFEEGDTTTSSDTVETPQALTGPYTWGTNTIANYRVKITVDKTKVPSNQTGFPVYVDLSHLPLHFFAFVASDGRDIRVYNSAIAELPYELVSIDVAAKTGELFFKGDLSSSVDTVFYIYYGNPSLSAYARTDTYGSNNVWMGNGANDFTNLIANPSFETNTTGYTAYVNGGTAGAPTLTRDTAEWLSGTASLKHVGAAGTQNYSGASVSIPGLTIGLTYRAVVYTKGTSGNNFNLYCDPSGPSTDTTQSGNWQRVTLDFVPTATTQTLYIRTSTDSATFYVDSVQVYLASENPTGHRAVYHMNDLTSGTVKNSSIGSFDGTKAGGGNAPVEVAGKVGKGQKFDGVSNTGKINVVENVIDVSKPFTFRALVRMDSIPNTGVNGILDKFQSNTGANVRGARITIDTAGKLRFESGYSQTTHTAITSTIWPTAMTIGQYYYVAGVFDGTNLRLHLNTTNQSVATQIPINGTSINFAIGCTHHSNGTLDGVIDEVLIVQSALPVNRLDAESNNLLTPSTFYSVGTAETVERVGKWGYFTWG
jgi:hypothetical protein